MRKVHSGLDRKRREFKAVLASSAGNDTTRGTPTEKKLKEAIAEGEKLDQILLDMEASWDQGGDVERMAEVSAKVVKQIKYGQKYSQAIKMLLKLEE